MSAARTALLSDRGAVRVVGEDAAKLLQGVITNDMDLLAAQPAIHAALLTPQGKILFEFLVVKAGEAFLLETVRDKAADLAKRLAMYRLRAKATIEDVSAAFRVLAVWGSPPQARPEGAITVPDPRLPELGHRILAATDVAANATADDYHAHRIALGVPESGRDYPLGDTFPHEADLDLLHGVSFTKGCFVGQEVVSRMQHRGTARKRVAPIEGTAPLTPGAEITAGSAAIGIVGSVAGTQALALLRLDRAAEAREKGEPLAAGGVAIALRKASWADFARQPAPAVTP